MYVAIATSFMVLNWNKGRSQTCFQGRNDLQSVSNYLTGVNLMDTIQGKRFRVWEVEFLQLCGYVTGYSLKSAE